MNAVIAKTGRTVSRLGFGGRLLTETSKSAVVAAVQSGVSLFDTSAHFALGASEQTLGDALSTSGGAAVVVSKAGFFPLADALASDLPPHAYHVSSPGSRGLAYSIHPDALRLQLRNSRTRLGRDKVDVYLLNCPERLLLQPGVNEELMYSRIATALEYLRDQVDAGLIDGFGIASNTMHTPTVQHHISLDRIVERVSQGTLEKFAAVQVPFNLLEREALLPESTLLRSVRRNDLFLMTHRLLNTVSGGLGVHQLSSRLASDLAESSEAVDPKADSALLVEHLSQDFERLVAVEEELADTLPQDDARQRLVWSETLASNLARLTNNHAAATHFSRTHLLPAVDSDVQQLVQQLNQTEFDAPDEREQLLTMLDTYRKILYTIAHRVQWLANLHQIARNEELSSTVGLFASSLADDPIQAQSLKLALAAVSKHGSVLCGMRSERDVAEMAHAWRQATSDQAEEQELQEAWQRLASGNLIDELMR
ncbi:hypothetical protein RI367_006750 [Sorochytrium milnesiophthora]